MNTNNISVCSRRTLKEASQLQHKKFRSQRNMLLIEGLLPLEEAAKSDYRIREVFYNPYLLEKPGVVELLAEIREKHGALCCDVGGRELKALSTEVTPQGIVATAEQKSFTEDDLQGNILLLDRIQDPGNAGTLFRIAHWFGLGGLLLTRGTVEAFNPKVVRGSMGSVFHLPFLEVRDIPQSLLEGRTLLLSKVHSGGDIRNYTSGKDKHFILAIGNEAGGISKEWDTLPHIDISMPVPGTAESLNAAVAAGVMLTKLLY